MTEPPKRRPKKAPAQPAQPAAVTEEGPDEPLDEAHRVERRGGRRANAGRKVVVPNGPYEILAKARAKGETFKAHITELEYKRQVGLLLPAEDVARIWADQIRIAKERLMAIPARVAPTVMRLDELRDVEQAIRNALIDAMTELSNAGHGAP